MGQEEELNSDDADYARALSSLLEPVDDFTDRWDREEHEELTSDRLKSIGLTENIYAKLLKKIPRNEQEAFRAITLARKI